MSTLQAGPFSDEFSQKLNSLEAQWHDISKQSDDRKTLIDNLASTWNSYQELMKKLQKSLDETHQFIDEHPVSECAVDDISPLLDKYKVFILWFYVEPGMGQMACGLGRACISYTAIS